MPKAVMVSHDNIYFESSCVIGLLKDKVGNNLGNNHASNSTTTRFSAANTASGDRLPSQCLREQTSITVLTDCSIHCRHRRQPG